MSIKKVKKVKFRNSGQRYIKEGPRTPVAPEANQGLYEPNLASSTHRYLSFG